MTGDFRFGREAAIAIAAGFVLAAIMFWPLPAHMTTDVMVDGGDPKLAAWMIGWGGHALLHHPTDIWQGNIFWPNRDSLAFSDSLLGYAPLAIFGGGQAGTLFAYNLATLLAYALAFAGVYLLARELGLSRGPAIVAGLAWAWCPWRWPQTGHLPVISDGPTPLAIALLLRGYRRQRPKAVLAGWLVAAWQLLITVSVALYMAYLLAGLAVVALVYWWRAGRPRPPPAIIKATAAGLAVLAAVGAFVALPYLRVADEHPEFQVQREAGLALFSPPPKGFLAADDDNLVWGNATAHFREGLDYPAEMTLFPGLLMLVLAVIGIAIGPLPRRLRISLAAAAALAAVFSLGLQLLDGDYTYRLLYDYLPGWDGPRTPSRLHIVTTLALSLLGGAGAAAVTGKVQRCVRSEPWRHRAPAVVCTALAISVLAEGASFHIGGTGDARGIFAGAPRAHVPKPPRGLERARPPLLELPQDITSSYDYVIWSTDTGFPDMVNGNSGFFPTRSHQILDSLAGFPSQASVDALRVAGVRTVVVHPGRMDPAGLEAIQKAPLDKLGVRREQSGDVILLDLGSGSR